ncbi:MAG: PilZ domain-containing protein [Pseudomonadota bacterium]
MVETADPNKKHYFKQLNSPRAVKEILTVLAKEKEVCTLWLQGQEKESTENFKIVELHNEYTLILQQEGSFWKKLFSSSLTNKSVLLRITYDKYQYFGSGILSFDNSNRQHFITPELDKFFQCQQRGTYRLGADNTTKIKLTVQNRTYLCSDVSGGGISFFARNQEKERYPKGAIFRDCVVKLNDKTFLIPYSAVVAIAEYKDNQATGKIKVAMQFKELAEELMNSLCQYINTLARDREAGRPKDS